MLRSSGGLVGFMRGLMALSRLVIISPYVDDKAAELARELGIEVYTDVM